MQSSLFGMAENAQQALEAAQLSLSPRARELKALEAFALGTQYEGRASWWNDDVPLWERAPCIVYLQTKAAIQSNCDLVLGTRGFPDITSNPGEDDSEAGGLSEDESEKVDRAIDEVCRLTKFRSVSRQALEHAQQSKSIAGIVGVRKGRPFIDLVRARWCEPRFDDQGRVSSLEIRYPYLAWRKGVDGKWKLDAKLYRRVIDAKSDTVYLPIDAPKDGRDPEPGDWKPDPAKTIEGEDRDLGFCPVVWYAHMKESSTVEDYDGEAIHQNILDQIQGLDFALSQKHRAALSMGDPQICEFGVEKGYNPSGAAKSIGVAASTAGGTLSGGNPQHGSYQETGGRTGRVKSPGVVWQYPDLNSKVEMLTLEKGSLEELDAHATDLRNKIAESLQVVILDAQNVKSTTEISGKAVEHLRSRQFDRCDQIRDDVGDGWLIPAVLMLLRVILKTKTPVKAVQNAGKALQRLLDEGPDAVMLTLRWPRGYVQPDALDEQAIITMTAAAKTAGFITRRMAVEKIAAIFGIESIEQAEEALDEAAEKAKQEFQEQEATKADALHGAMAALGQDGPGQPGKPPKAKKPTPGKKAVPGGSGEPEGSSPKGPQVPVTKQETTFTCGVACLRAVLRFFGIKPEPEEELTDEMEVERDTGTEPDAIVEAAEDRGLVAEFVEGMPWARLVKQDQTGEKVIALIQGTSGPADGWDGGHYVVVESADQEEVRIMDPERGQAGKQTLSREDFTERWHSYARADQKSRRAAIVISAGESEAA
jgi:predicted double-glycine peptidase